MDVGKTVNSSADSSSKPSFNFKIKRAGDHLLEVHVKRNLDNIIKRSSSTGHLPKIFRVQLPESTKVDIKKYEELLTHIFNECHGDLNQLKKMKFKGKDSGTKWNLKDVKESRINKIFRFLERKNILKLFNSTPPKFIYNLKLEEIVGSKVKEIQMPTESLKSDDPKEEGLFKDPFTKIATYANTYLESNFQSRDLDTHSQIQSDYVIVKKDDSLSLVYNSDINKGQNMTCAKEALEIYKKEMSARFGKEKLDYMSHLAFFDLDTIEYLTPEHVYRLNILACSVESQDVQSLIVKMHIANTKLNDSNADLKEELEKMDFLSSKEVQSVIKFLKEGGGAKPTVSDLKNSMQAFSKNGLTDLYAIKLVILAKSGVNDETPLADFLNSEKLEISKDFLQYFGMNDLKVKDFIPLFQTILLLKDEMKKTSNKEISVKKFVEKFFTDHPHIYDNQFKIIENVNIEKFLSMMDEPDSKLNESEFNKLVTAIGPTYQEKQDAYTGRKITKAVLSRYTIAGHKYYKPWIEQQELLQISEILEKDSVKDPYTGRTHNLTQKEKMRRFDEISAHIFSKKHLFRPHPTEGYRVGEILPGPSGKNGEKRWYRVERMISSGEGLLNYQLEPLGTDSKLQTLCASRSTAPSLYSYQAGATVRNDLNPLSAPGYQGRKDMEEGMNPILKDHFIPDWVAYQYSAKMELAKDIPDLAKVKNRLIEAGKFLEEGVKRGNKVKSLHEVIREYNSDVLLLSTIGAKKKDLLKKMLLILPSKRNEFEKTVLHFANNFSINEIENENEKKRAFRIKQELRGARVLLKYIDDTNRKQGGKLDPRLQRLKNEIVAIRNKAFEPKSTIADIPEGGLKECIDATKNLDRDNLTTKDLAKVEKKLSDYATSIGENVESKKSNGIRFTGHSLGGACAQIEASFMMAGSYRVPVPRTTIDVVAFDAPGINEEDNVRMYVHMAKHSEVMSDLKSLVKVYHSHEYGDIVPLGGSAHLGSRNAALKKALGNREDVGETFQVETELQRATSYAVELETVDLPTKHETRFATTKQERTEELKQVEREIENLSKKKAASDQLMKVVKKGGSYRTKVQDRDKEITTNLDILKAERLKYLGGKRVTKIDVDELGSLTEKSSSKRRAVRRKWGMGIFDKERIKKIMTISGLSIMPAFFKKQYSPEKRQENLMEKGHGEAKEWWNPISHSLCVTRNGGPIDLSNIS